MASEFTPERMRTPGGAEFLRVDFSQKYEDAQAAVFIKKLGEGGEFFGKPLLIVTFKLAQVGPQMRAQLDEIKGPLAKNTAPIVVVSPATLLRIALKGMMILSPYAGPVKVSADEPEALAWMAEQLDGGAQA